MRARSFDLRSPTGIALGTILSIAACSSKEEIAPEPPPTATDAGADAALEPEGAPPVDAGNDVTAADVCSPSLGLSRPLPACSNETPCDRPAPELKGEILRVASTPPTCPSAMQLDTSDVAGFRRYACIRSPASATTATKRPLVLWFHPGGEGADNVAETQLVSRAATYELGAPGDQGFHLVVVQGRNLRFPTRQPRDGRHHDFYHRDMASPSKNPDIAYADALVDRLVANGTVDPKRIYVMGWSNGGFFGQLYAIARRNAATPGGSKVAAAAVFATANPFEDVRWDPFANVAKANASSCRLAKIPSSAVPVMLVYRTCDAAVAATPAQATCFDTEPGYVTEPWLTEAAAAGLAYTPLRLGGRETGPDLDQPVAAATNPTCTPTSCTPTVTAGCLCLVNHLIWPDGVYPNASSNIDHEVDMLEFLKTHPLP
ncbi:MAG: hypothetical protein JST00_23765 [Deltaproteobacteria bacterium]|nr:hypothetical protein [Deltaproteobacteria bacterium]